LNRGGKCPICGAEAEEFGFFDLKLLLEVKDNLDNDRQMPNGEEKPNFKGEDALEKDSQSYKETKDLIKAIFEQNKTIIQQNELIYNELLKKK
jgi:hypothetical protein